MNNIDPGGGGPSRPLSYANRVKQRSYKKLDRNVLQIMIEKTDKNKIVQLNGDQVAEVCEIVGVRVGVETEGYQTQYRGKVIMLAIWVKEAVSLERFVSEQSKFFSSDMTITSVRPAVTRDVTVLVTGLAFNTPDSQVKEYIECFGAKLVSSDPVYGVHREGPWKGQYNGDRRYRADFSAQVLPMGTYHLLGGARVRVIYLGNTKTCGKRRGQGVWR